MEHNDAGNAETLDILADLSTVVRRPAGVPCRIAKMRRDRPDLIPQWDRVIDAKRRGTTDATKEEIVAWFAARQFIVSKGVIERHVNSPCTWCDLAIVA